MITRVVSEWMHLGADTGGELSLPCPAGHVIVGGGVETNAREQKPTTPPNILASYPRFDDNRWIGQVGAGVFNGTDFRVYAVCLRAT